MHEIKKTLEVELNRMVERMRHLGGRWCSIAGRWTFEIVPGYGDRSPPRGLKRDFQSLHRPLRRPRTGSNPRHEITEIDPIYFWVAWSDTQGVHWLDPQPPLCDLVRVNGGDGRAVALPSRTSPDASGWTAPPSAPPSRPSPGRAAKSPTARGTAYRVPRNSLRSPQAPSRGRRGAQDIQSGR